jgi:hypothetical protein
MCVQRGHPLFDVDRNPRLALPEARASVRSTGGGREPVLYEEREWDHDNEELVSTFTAGAITLIDSAESRSERWKQ